MAGGGSPTPVKGGKKAVDFTVNLVPTIDLLSVLIAFLLITAVWTQLARINAQQVLPKTSDKPQEDDPNKKPEKKLYVFLTPDETSVNFTDEQPSVFKKLDGDVNDAVAKHVKAIAEKIEDKKKQAVIVAATDMVEYRQMIDTMDILLDNGLAGMSIGDADVVKGMMPDDPNSPPPGGGPAPTPPPP